MLYVFVVVEVERALWEVVVVAVEEVLFVEIEVIVVLRYYL
jgi:hypothetical protein